MRAVGALTKATSRTFTNYADSRYSSLLVTNNYGLIGGRDAEADDDYRYRISLRLQSHGGAAEADLRLAVLAVPGIQDCVFERLAGTFLCYVYGISAVVPPSLLALVQGQMDDIPGLSVLPQPEHLTRPRGKGRPAHPTAALASIAVLEPRSGYAPRVRCRNLFCASP
jgi:hypothetical protein